MEALGLFEAKTHFSEVVARAEAGEEVIITRHNKPVAKVVPIGPADVVNDAAQRERAQAIQWLMANRMPMPEGQSIRQMIDEGRR